jgi:hypothetical protein
MTHTNHTITRREALKRGALVGGVAVLWTVPVVQSFGMSRAQAQAVSEVCTIYCIVWHPSNAGAPSGWAVSEGDKCLPCPTDSEASLPTDVNDFTVEYSDAADTYTVTFPAKYSLVPSGDPTPDPLVPSNAAIRHGENTKCTFLTVEENNPGPGVPANTTQIQFTDWDMSNPGDRIELVLQECV